MKNTFIQEKLKPQLTFNPGLAALIEVLIILVKGKATHGAKLAHTAGTSSVAPVSVNNEANRGIATPPGWDASPSQHFVAGADPFILLGGEGHCES